MKIGTSAVLEVVRRIQNPSLRMITAANLLAVADGQKELKGPFDPDAVIALIGIRVLAFINGELQFRCEGVREEIAALSIDQF